MKNIVVYKESNQSLSKVEFIKNISSQRKIRDLKGVEDTNLFNKSVALIFTVAANKLKIKDGILDENKEDIVELLLMNFKGLSLDEVAYAFKLERFGNLGDKTEHYQVFDTDYVGQVLRKYMEWKSKKRVELKLHDKKMEKQKDIEKLYYKNRAVRKSLDHYLKKGFPDPERPYVYIILTEEGFIKDTKEQKESIKNDALHILKNELLLKKQELEKDKEVSLRIQLMRKNQSLEIGKQLKKLEKGTFNGVRDRCRLLSLEDFFRKLSKNNDYLKKFMDNFSTH